MTFSLQKTVLFLVLFVAQAYGRAPEAITAAHDGVTLMAKAMTASECVDTFFQDLHGNRIFPIAITIHNTSNDALKLSSENIEISGAKIVTPKSIEAEISSMKWATAFLALTVVLSPLCMATTYQIAKLKALIPIVKHFSFGDTAAVITPHQKLETIVFAEVDYPEDAEGKTVSYSAPEYFDITLTLKNNSFFSLQAPIFFGLHVPTV